MALDLNVERMFVGKLRKSSSPRAVGQVLSDIREMNSGNVPNILYGCAIEVLSGLGKSRDALDLLRVCGNEGHAPSATTFTTAVRSCIVEHDWQSVVAMLAEMERHRVAPTISTINAAINVCKEAGESDVAVKLLDGMESKAVVPDRFSYNTVVAACEKKGRWEAAFAVLDRMCAAGFAPDAIALNSVASALAKGGQGSRCVGFVQAEMEARFAVPPDNYSFGAALNGCALEGRWEAAAALLGDMAARGLRPSGFHYSSALRACAKASAQQDAAGKPRAPAGASPPDSTGLSSWETGLRLLGEMDAGPKVDGKANTIRYNVALSALDRAGR
jgi:pentatricopeptide repeat protein